MKGMGSDEIIARLMYITDLGTSAVSRVLSDSIARNKAAIMKGDDIIIFPGFIEKVQGGFTIGEESAVGARPGDGKTNLMINLAHLFAKLYPDDKCLIISREMSSLQLEKRFLLLNAEGKIRYSDLRTGKPLEGEIAKIAEETTTKMQKLYKNIIVEDGIEDIDGSISAILKHRPKFIMDDFIQLATSEKYGEDKVRFMVNSLLKTYKWLAKKLSFHALNFSQLNRNIESRLDQTPVMSDFNESGMIEQLCEFADILRTDTKERQTHYILKARHGKAGNAYYLPYEPDRCYINLEDK
jgi:replicative DNA helicase